VTFVVAQVAVDETQTLGARRRSDRVRRRSLRQRMAAVQTGPDHGAATFGRRAASETTRRRRQDVNVQRTFITKSTKIIVQ